MRAGMWAAALALVAAAILSTSGRADSAGGTWIGPLNGSSAFVAIVSDGDQLVGYVCDNGTVGSWFFSSDGALGAHRIIGKDGSVLDVTLDDKRARGTFTKDGDVQSFEARATDKQVLFRADAVAGGSTVLAGWIQNGNESRGTLITGGSTLLTAPQLDTTVPVTINTNFIVLTPTPMTPDSLAASTTNSTKFVWGAMGDSFASGEGDPEVPIADPSNIDSFTGLSWGDDSTMFVPDGYSLRSDVTTCHRSDRAGAPKANADLRSFYPGMNFALGFVACSGATTHALMTAGYQGPDVNSPAQLGFLRVPQPAQLDRIATYKSSQGGQLDALYMSIGGNDIGFGSIIQDCLILPDCSQSDSGLLSQNLAALATTYNTLGTSIVQHFSGAVPPVLISDYPNPLDHGAGGQPCHGDDYDATGDVIFPGYDLILKDGVSQTEANWAYGIPDLISQVINTAAIDNNWNVVSAHTQAFLGHGVCTSQPWFNLNSAALHRQGHDLGGPLDFSAGFMHPNDLGYAAYGTAIAAGLRQYVDARAKTGLVAPANVRVGAATQNGAITLHWDDRSTSENGDEVEVLPARTQDAALIVVPSGATPFAGGFRVRVNGVGAQQYVHQVSGGGRFLYRVRACQSGIQGNDDAECGPWSAQITGTNVLPAAPTGVHLANVVLRLAFVTELEWSAQPDAIEFAVHIDFPDGSSTDGRTSSTAWDVPTVTSGTTYRVAACNRVGCSSYTSISG